MKINFDMDGTIADLYGVEGWLADLRSEKVRPYAVASPLWETGFLTGLLTALQSKGHEINVISWGSKNATAEYSKRIENAKKRWLAYHFDGFTFDNVFVVPYGTKKSSLADGILFDDDMRVREDWEANGFIAYEPKEIIEILEKLLDN